MAEETEKVKDVREELALHPLLQVREGLIEKYRARLPILGQFSADQYAKPEEGMSEAFIPRWKKGMPFTRFNRKHIRPYLRVAWVAEIQNAARELRYPSLENLLDRFEWALGQLDGWASEQYLRTGVAGLTPPKEVGFWRGLFSRRR